MLKFYTNPQSRGRMVRWMLEEVGQPYETVVLEFGDAMQSPDYLAINPMGKVPALVHDKTIITETPAIITYLADQFPEAGLMPEDRGAFYRWMFFAAGPLEMAQMHKALDLAPPAKGQGMLGYGTYEKLIAALRDLLTSKTYLIGQRFSAADVYMGSHIIWGLTLKTLAPDPIFSAYADHLMARAAYQRANSKDDALLGEG